MAKDYYFILGVPANANFLQIRDAYRQLVKELHPDRYGDDTNSFLDVQEAYSVLADPARRRAYDATLHRPTSVPRDFSRRPEPIRDVTPSPEPLRPGNQPAQLGEVSLAQSFRSFSPSYDEIFDRLWSNFSSLSRPKSETLESLTAEITLTPEQARMGGNVRVMIPARAQCPTCEGYGGVGPYLCWRCSGQGEISGEFPLMLSFPPGIVNEYVVRVPLTRFGIRNFYLTVRFRTSRAG